jgi:hypothetical protein
MLSHFIMFAYKKNIPKDRCRTNDCYYLPESTLRDYSLVTFQVGCISCHPFGLSVTHAPHI